MVVGTTEKHDRHAAGRAHSSPPSQVRTKIVVSAITNTDRSSSAPVASGSAGCFQLVKFLCQHVIPQAHLDIVVDVSNDAFFVNHQIGVPRHVTTMH